MDSFNQVEKEQLIEPHAKVRTQSASWVILFGIIFIAVNLRAPFTSVGPLVELIRDDLHISNTLAGMITTLPLLAFALFSPFAPKLAKRYGVERILFMSIILLSFGIILRSISGIANLYLGTVVLGIAIAVGNVLLPSLIKQEYPERIGLMTGVYSISMNLFSAIASGISIPVAVGMGYGWQGALGIWGILSLLSILVWFPQVRRRSVKKTALLHQTGNTKVNLWRSKLAWKVTLFMGLQSMLYYVLVAWLPNIIMDKGVSIEESGWFVSIMQLTCLPVTFLAPILAGRMANQRLLVTVTAVCFMVGNVGLLYGNLRFMVVWVVLLGLGAGLAFGLAMIFFSLRTANAKQAAELSGMAQSVGYLLAAMGPTLFGYLNDLTNSWMIPLLILVGASVLLFLFGLGAGRNRYVSSSK
ncbi:CynX/NimT family MFS transporter [Bacillus benzoevorans]|nr:MFS transporter [Bacillus benzoevorans]